MSSPDVTFMRRLPHLAVLTIFTAAGLAAAGCAAKPQVLPVAQPEHVSSTLIALLPDPVTGQTGRAQVSNPYGSVDLVVSGAATRATASGPPEPVSPMSDADVARLFGAALAAMPPGPQHFTLYFRFESDTLTAESSALVPRILQAVTEFPVPDVVVIGHTDTMGDPTGNVALGLKRAANVQQILVGAGLDRATVAARSHGEADLLVMTPNNVAEPRNRRVEISVR
jgi:outer membrane protein OmpA-like peptidoglycan-associated protein